VFTRRRSTAPRWGPALKELGYGEVYNLGAFKDWAEGGGPVDK
jgi:rhodanese-related sulfurtransferase